VTSGSRKSASSSVDPSIPVYILSVYNSYDRLAGIRSSIGSGSADESTKRGWKGVNVGSRRRVLAQQRKTWAAFLDAVGHVMGGEYA
jgi:hypothetical protein